MWLLSHVHEVRYGIFSLGGASAAHPQGFLAVGGAILVDRLSLVPEPHALALCMGTELAAVFSPSGGLSCPVLPFG